LLGAYLSLEEALLFTLLLYFSTTDSIGVFSIELCFEDFLILGGLFDLFFYFSFVFG
jgi:hypothetical protein